jgi:hypothetical protein
MSHATDTNKAPAWGIETNGGHSVFLLPCDCCEATTVTIEAGTAVVSFEIGNLKKLAELRDYLSAVIEHQKHRPRHASVGDDEETDGLWVRRWEGHAPASIREAFHCWLDDLAAGPLEGRERREFKNEVLPAFSACTDILPREFCEALDLPTGITYAEAVDSLRLKV